MAKWDKIRESGNVDDRRGTRSVAGIRGMGISGIIMLLLVGYFGGPDEALRLFENMNQNSHKTEIISQKFEGNDSYEDFAKKVLGSNNSLWKEIFTENNLVYNEPKLVLFRDYTHSACAGARSDIGPHYCGADKTIYLDETFFDEMKKTLGARGGDVAEAYVIAHEVGHHIQNELGTIDFVDRQSQKNPRKSNEFSQKLELQADCYAGIWVGKIASEGILEAGEIMEAIDAAKSVGDDNVQKRFEGEIRPENWTHGSSENRKKWFEIGYKTHDPEQCDTFRQKK